MAEFLVFNLLALASLELARLVLGLGVSVLLCSACFFAFLFFLCFGFLSYIMRCLTWLVYLSWLGLIELDLFWLGRLASSQDLDF